MDDMFSRVIHPIEALAWPRSSPERRARWLLRAAGAARSWVVGVAVLSSVAFSVSVFFSDLPPLAAVVPAAVFAGSVALFVARRWALTSLRSTARTAATELDDRPATMLMLAVLDLLSDQSYPLPRWLQGRSVPGVAAPAGGRDPMSALMVTAVRLWMGYDRPRAWMDLFVRMTRFSGVDAATVDVVRLLASASIDCDRLWHNVASHVPLGLTLDEQPQFLMAHAIALVDVVGRCHPDTVAVMAVLSADTVRPSSETLSELEQVAVAVLT